MEVLPHLRNQADKIFGSFSTILGFRSACFLRERQVGKHKIGSPVHIINVRRRVLYPFAFRVRTPHYPRNRQWPYSSVLNYSETAMYMHGVMDKLKYLTNQGTTTLIRRLHGLSSTKTVKGKQRFPGCKDPLQ